VNPELEFVLGPGWKIAGVLFGGGVLWAKVNALDNSIKSFRKALFGENGDGPIIVTNTTCLEREERLVQRIDEAKDAVEVVDGKVESLGGKVANIDGRLRVVESRPGSG
jgi:hypothetical protein